jgi:hypothetical protein
VKLNLEHIATLANMIKQLTQYTIEKSENSHSCSSKPALHKSVIGASFAIIRMLIINIDMFL